MNESPKKVAERATFQAFLNSYIREVKTETWFDGDEWRKRNQTNITTNGAHVIELTLLCQNIRFAIEVTYKSFVGRHTFGYVFKYSPTSKYWLLENEISVIITLIQELNVLTEGGSSHYDELILRLIDSYQTMSRFIEERKEEGEVLYSVYNRFIESERSLLFGHWFHPTPKSRQGMLTWQQKQFSPELEGAFKLHYFKVKREWIKEDSALEKSASELVKEALMNKQSNILPDGDEVLLPVHPLQAQWLLQQADVQKRIEEGVLESVGQMGPSYAATSSVRTVYHPEEEWMYKFSIPVKVTNSLRVNRLHELKAGVTMARLMEKMDFLQNYPSFRIIQDPAYMTIDFGDGKESGFEVIIRSNEFKKGNDQGVTSVAAFVQEPLPGFESRLKQLIYELADKERASIKEISLRWFEQYFRCAIIPLVRLYDEYGIALEAHQQNSVLDLSKGFPTAYYFRDNQGYYLAKSHKEHLLLIEPSLVEIPELFYDESIIKERFTYYLCFNQLFSIIHRFGVDELIEEEVLVEWVLNELQQLEKELTGAGKRFVQYLLSQEHIPCKANLLTRFHDVDELMAKLEQAVYTVVENPFVLSQRAVKREEKYEPVSTGSH